MDSIPHRIDGIACRMTDMVIGSLAYHAVHHILADGLVSTLGTKGKTFESTRDTFLLQAF